MPLARCENVEIRSVFCNEQQNTFDLWMARIHPDLPWCRYADDGLVHCRTQQEAEALKAALPARLAECHLEMHPTKTKIVYCKDRKQRQIPERQV
jgi:retron-type reverse transcriptase